MALIEAAMAIIDPTFRAVSAPSTLRLGRVACEASADVTGAFDHALGRGEASLTPMTLALFDAAFAANIAIIGAETWSAFGHLTAGEGLGDDVRTRLLKARNVDATQLHEAERVRTAFRAEVDASLEELDALVLPTMPVFPPTIAEAADPVAALALTALVRQFNLSGHPALTIPAKTARGLPIGIQLVGRIGGDEVLCAVGRSLTAGIDAMSALNPEEQFP
jgi:amidase